MWNAGEGIITCAKQTWQLSRRVTDMAYGMSKKVMWESAKTVYSITHHTLQLSVGACNAAYKVATDPYVHNLLRQHGMNLAVNALPMLAYQMTWNDLSDNDNANMTTRLIFNGVTVIVPIALVTIPFLYSDHKKRGHNAKVQSKGEAFEFDIYRRKVFNDSIINGMLNIGMPMMLKGLDHVVSKDTGSTSGAVAHGVMLSAMALTVLRLSYHMLNLEIHQMLLNSTTPRALVQTVPDFAQPPCYHNQKLLQGLSRQEAAHFKLEDPCSKESFGDATRSVLAYTSLQILLGLTGWLKGNPTWLVLMRNLHQAQFIASSGMLKACTKHAFAFNNSGLTIAIAATNYIALQSILNFVPNNATAYMKPLLNNLMPLVLTFSWAYAPKQVPLTKPIISLDPTLYANLLIESILTVLKPGIEKAIKKALKEQDKPAFDIKALCRRLNSMLEHPRMQPILRFSLPDYFIDWRAIRQQPMLMHYASQWFRAYCDFLKFLSKQEKRLLSQAALGAAKYRYARKAMVLGLNFGWEISKPLTNISLLILSKPELRQLLNDAKYRLQAILGMQQLIEHLSTELPIPEESSPEAPFISNTKNTKVLILANNSINRNSKENNTVLTPLSLFKPKKQHGLSSVQLPPGLR